MAVNTGGMSANSTGSIYDKNNHNGVFPGHSITGTSGCISLLKNSATEDGWSGSSSGAGCYGIKINVSHTHNVTASGYLYGNTDSSGGDESRPFNFTIKVWKRIA